MTTSQQFQQLNIRANEVFEYFYKTDTSTFLQLVSDLGADVSVLNNGDNYVRQCPLSPLAFLLTPCVPIVWIEQAMAKRTICAYGDVGVVDNLIAHSQHLEPKAVRCLTNIIDHSDVLKRHIGHCSDRNNGQFQNAARRVLTHTPHSVDALVAWQDGMRFPTFSWTAAVSSILNNNINNARSDRPTKTAVELIVAMHQCGVEDNEIFRNINILGLVGESDERLSECFQVFDAWLHNKDRYLGLGQIVGRLAHEQMYAYFFDDTQHRLINHTDVHRDTLTHLNHLEVFNQHVQRLLNAHGFSVQEFAEMAWSGEHVDKCGGGFLWTCFLKNASTEQWNVYWDGVVNDNPVCKNTHAILRNEQGYQQKMLQQHVKDLGEHKPQRKM